VAFQGFQQLVCQVGLVFGNEFVWVCIWWLRLGGDVLNRCEQSGILWVCVVWLLLMIVCVGCGLCMYRSCLVQCMRRFEWVGTGEKEWHFVCLMCFRV